MLFSFPAGLCGLAQSHWHFPHILELCCISKDTTVYDRSSRSAMKFIMQTLSSFQVEQHLFTGSEMRGLQCICNLAKQPKTRTISSAVLTNLVKFWNPLTVQLIPALLEVCYPLRQHFSPEASKIAVQRHM